MEAGLVSCEAGADTSYRCDSIDDEYRCTDDPPDVCAPFASILSVADFLYFPLHTLGSLPNSVAAACNFAIGNESPVCAKAFLSSFCPAGSGLDCPAFSEEATVVYSDEPPFGTEAS